MIKLSNIVFIILLILGFISVTYYLGYKDIMSIFPSHTTTVTYTDTTTYVDTTTYTISDTTTHYQIVEIPNPLPPDTIYIPQNIDSLEIIKDYYTTHTYKRSWHNEDLTINLTDFVTQNQIIKSDLTYKILRPQQIINNTTNITTTKRYIGLGLSSSFKSIEVSAIYITPTLDYGLSYDPFNKQVRASLYYNILKL